MPNVKSSVKSNTPRLKVADLVTTIEQLRAQIDQMQREHHDAVDTLQCAVCTAEQARDDALVQMQAMIEQRAALLKPQADATAPRRGFQRTPAQEAARALAMKTGKTQPVQS